MVGIFTHSETVSTLTSAGAPNQLILTSLFAIYNIYVILLAAGLYFGAKIKRPNLGSIFLAAAGICGLVLFWFPRDYPQGPPTTFTRTIHVAVAGIIAFASLAAILAYGLSFRKIEDWKRFAKLSLVWLPIALMLGAFGAISITAPYAGLAERLSISSILVWIEVAALTLIMKSRKAANK